MTAKNRNLLISAAIVVAIAAGSWYAYSKSKLSKTDKIKFIYESDKTTVSQNGLGYQPTLKFYLGTGDDYIDAWYTALKNDQPTFENNGITISAQTGRSTVKAK